MIIASHNWWLVKYTSLQSLEIYFDLRHNVNENVTDYEPMIKDWILQRDTQYIGIQIVQGITAS